MVGRGTHKSAHGHNFWDRGRGEKIVIKHLIKVHALACVFNQAAANKAFSVTVERDVVREGKLTSLDLFVRLLHFDRLEGGPATEHRVQDDTDAPVVNFV